MPDVREPAANRFASSPAVLTIHRRHSYWRSHDATDADTLETNSGYDNAFGDGASCVGARSKPLPILPRRSRPSIPRVDQILSRLENRAVHDLRADVSWKLMYLIDLDEDAIVKQGRIWYQQQKPVAKFLVHFDRKITSNRAHKLDERHMFDGRWYVELKSETKTVTRREVRRAG